MIYKNLDFASLMPAADLWSARPAGPSPNVLDPALQTNFAPLTPLTMAPSIPKPSIGNRIMEGAQKAAPMIAMIGVVNQAIGGFFSTLSAVSQQKSMASTLRFQASLAGVNASRAEGDAEQISAAGGRQIGQVTMAAGQREGTAKAAFGARGIALGDGSAKEAIASNDLMKQIDELTINSNTVRAAGAARTQSTNYQVQSLMDNASANNYAASAGSISPFAAGASSLLNGATMVSSRWFRANSMGSRGVGGAY